jgi:hypothetical protein
VPLQRIVTSGGTPALRVRCEDGAERTIALLTQYWVTPITQLLAVSTEPPKRAKQPKPDTVADELEFAV